MQITLAKTDDELSAVQSLFEQTIGHIESTAVPRGEQSHALYKPLVAQAHNDSGELVGAALTCRAQIAASSAMMAGAGRDLLGYGDVLDKHSELDLLAVRSDARRGGLGSALVLFLEDRLRDAGVEVWFGNATRDLQVDDLRRFYERHGFTIGAIGRPLPELLGRRWDPPFLSEQPAFYFWKSLTEASVPSASRPADGTSSRVRPPDARKARRTGRSRRRKR